MTIRPRIEPADLCHAPVLAALHAECFDEVWSQAAVEELLRMPGAFARLALVAEAGAVGFALARLAADEAELLSLGVIPAWRGRGIAEALLLEVIDDAAKAGAGTLYLEVAETNEPARRLYAAHGFAAVGRRPDYYRRPNAVPVAALTLRRALPR